MTHTPLPATAPSSMVTNSLVLTRVRQSFAGTYTCTVTIGASSMSRSVSLAVTGEFVILMCEIYFMLLYTFSSRYTYLYNGEPVTFCSS